MLPIFVHLQRRYSCLYPMLVTNYHGEDAMYVARHTVPDYLSLNTLNMCLEYND